MTADLPSPSPELGAWLEANREPLIRRWLELVVERSTLDELAARPLADRVHELDLLLEAAHSEGTGGRGGLGDGLDHALARELEAGRAFARELEAGRPFALALLDPPAGGPEPERWTEAAAEAARREEHVVAVAGGLTAVVIPAADAGRARIEADRIRAVAWQTLGGVSVLPELGFASHPADGDDAATLVAAALGQLGRAEPAERAEPAYEPPDIVDDPPAEPARALREELDRWARNERDHTRRDLWAELSAEEDASDDAGPQADVTPLYPPRPR